MTQDNSKQSSPYGMLTDAHFAHILEYLRQNPRAVMEITKVRVELVLVPTRNYDLQQLFFKEDNLFVIIVKELQNGSEVSN